MYAPRSMLAPTPPALWERIPGCSRTGCENFADGELDYPYGEPLCIDCTELTLDRIVAGCIDPDLAAMLPGLNEQ